MALAITQERRAYHSARGYTTADRQVTLKATPGSTITSYRAGVIVKRINATNYIRAYINDDGAQSTLNLESVTAGVAASLATGVVLGSRVSNGTAFWIRCRIEGNVIVGEYFTQEPYPTLAATSTIGPVTLSGSAATTFGRGVAGTAGWLWVPQHTSATLDDYKDEPYTYSLGSSPTIAADHLTLYGVPGTAPAQVALQTTSTYTSNSIRGLLLGWVTNRGIENLVWNGHFDSVDSDTEGWTAAAVSGITNAATSITRVTTASKYGSASGEVVTPATADSGVTFPIYRRFKKGVTYTAVAWMQSAAHTTTTRLRLGVSGDNADSTATALTTSFAQHTATWTPTADRDVAYVAAMVTAATATTFRIDGIQVYEGTTAPTSGFQSEGEGAFAPIGLIEAEATSRRGSSTITADATASGGQSLKATGVTNNGTMTARFRLDPSLVPTDDFADSVTIEFWGRFRQTVTAYQPTIRIRAIPVDGTVGAIPWTESDVGALTFMPPDTDWDLVRVGAVTFPVGGATRTIWEARVEVTFPAASVSGDFYIDYLIALPARQRVAGDIYAQALTGVSAYPVGARVESDLRTFALRWPGPVTQTVAGPGGQHIEFTPGTVTVLHKTTVKDLGTDGRDDGTSIAPPGQTVHFAVTPRYHITRSA